MTTIRAKYRVYVTQLCRKCKRVHPQPTRPPRYIFHQGEGEAIDVVQHGSIIINNALDIENRAEYRAKKRSLQRRALYQYHVELDQ